MSHLFEGMNDHCLSGQSGGGAFGDAAEDAQTNLTLSKAGFDLLTMESFLGELTLQGCQLSLQGVDRGIDGRSRGSQLGLAHRNWLTKIGSQKWGVKGQRFIRGVLGSSGRSLWFKLSRALTPSNGKVNTTLKTCISG